MFPFSVRLLRAAMISLVPALAALAALPAQAAGDTMSKIRETHTIVLGVREAVPPFSFVNAQKQPTGYSVDLCMNAVEEIKRELKLSDIKVQYKLVAGPERIPKLIAGEIDLECGSTTNTMARQEKVDFSYTFFVAGMRVLTNKGLHVETVKDLKNMPIALAKGSTSEKLFRQLGDGELRDAKFTTYDNNGEAYKALKEGKVRAFAQDDSLLQGLVSNDKEIDTLSLSRLALSVEPYAVMVRKGDTALLAAVDRSLAQLYASGEINALYDKWFNTHTLTIKMGRLTRDSFVRPNKQPGVAMVLGHSI
ncbi:glutamate/aspartate transport system substrate-binding protein [Variovorax boronicumulans]|uniref:amino acid ABC transporter substrate-binding protein n=1 Tax=Variovorax boronicumulans TaxID=436515 RepID=UPI0024732C48|nr:amino acid ABC transporter substrate-binding protein [Variovorax boronicumulans]MDH6167806.1 glutamate/aspartate transport system substrate-binding protein [Variovorax boronicumulans]